MFTTGAPNSAHHKRHELRDDIEVKNLEHYLVSLLPWDPDHTEVRHASTARGLWLAEVAAALGYTSVVDDSLTSA